MIQGRRQYIAYNLSKHQLVKKSNAIRQKYYLMECNGQQLSILSIIGQMLFLKFNEFTALLNKLQ